MEYNFKRFSDEMFRAFNIYWELFFLALPRITMAIVLLIAVLFIASRVSRLINKKLSGKVHDPLFLQFIVRLTKFALITCGIILVLQTLGLSGIAGGLLAGAGISAFIFGFAFRNIAENFLAGIILAFNRPFALNDTVKIEDYLGRVVALNFRTTHIKTFDEKDVFIPNSKVIKETLTNLTRDGWIRLDFLVGIAYEDDIGGAIELITKNIQQEMGVILDKNPFVVVENLAESTVNLRIFFWTTTNDYRKGVLMIKSSVIKNVKETLIANGFTLPARIQELKLYDKKNSFPVKIITSDDI